ncbi:MAG: PDDEXK nuclease domain-containing protein [Candidatus Kapabacteria bacterium]|nr:PDDEXK nuclease domain-containing protein [Candidatus Kapabacteria bacterium]
MGIIFNEIVELIKNARYDALKAVNKQLIDLYWKVGEHVSQRVANEGWGKGTIMELSKYISIQEPNITGFSPQNIWRMKQFYKTYNTFPKLSPLVRELSWTNNLLILSKSTSIEEKEFYLRLTFHEKYSKRELSRQIDSCYYERTILSALETENKNLLAVLKENHPNASSYFKDIYMFDFLNLPEDHSEFQLKKGIINNLKSFLLEIGKDFSFVGEEYQLQVGNQDFYLDLLFYHQELCCLVAFELKIDDFKPEYLGKLNFYLEALDLNVKKPHEKPSVGVLLCKSKDSDIVEYALSRSLSPALIAEYTTKLIDKKLLQFKLNEFYDIADQLEIN